jgi:poly(3-hydroxybutyrate) depolymerase
LAETVIGCSDETDVYSKGKAKCTEWQTCPNDERIALCIIDGMDHDISTEATYGFEGVETAYLYLKGGFPSDELNGKNLIWLPYGFLFILYLLIV